MEQLSVIGTNDMNREDIDDLGRYLGDNVDLARSLVDNVDLGRYLGDKSNETTIDINEHNDANAEVDLRHQQSNQSHRSELEYSGQEDDTEGSKLNNANSRTKKDDNVPQKLETFESYNNNETNAVTEDTNEKDKKATDNLPYPRPYYEKGNGKDFGFEVWSKKVSNELLHFMIQKQKSERPLNKINDLGRETGGNVPGMCHFGESTEEPAEKINKETTIDKNEHNNVKTKGGFLRPQGHQSRRSVFENNGIEDERKPYITNTGGTKDGDETNGTADTTILDKISDVQKTKFQSKANVTSFFTYANPTIVTVLITSTFLMKDMFQSYDWVFSEFQRLPSFDGTVYALPIRPGPIFVPPEDDNSSFEPINTTTYITRTSTALPQGGLTRIPTTTEAANSFDALHDSPDNDDHAVDIGSDRRHYPRNECGTYLPTGTSIPIEPTSISGIDSDNDQVHSIPENIQTVSTGFRENTVSHNGCTRSAVQETHPPGEAGPSVLYDSGNCLLSSGCDTEENTEYTNDPAGSRNIDGGLFSGIQETQPPGQPLQVFRIHTGLQAETTWMNIGNQIAHRFIKAVLAALMFLCIRQRKRERKKNAEFRI